jgi:hypothetical protein
LVSSPNKKTVCKHDFCKTCIYKWIETCKDSTCPTCRTKLNKYNVSEPYDPSLDLDDEDDYEIKIIITLNLNFS